MSKKKSLLLVLLTIIILIIILGIAYWSIGFDVLKNDYRDNIFNEEDTSLTSVVEDNREDAIWEELDQLNTYPEIRKEVDKAYDIISFSLSSKNGVLYVDEEGGWLGNSVMLNAYKNEEFMENYIDNEACITKIASKVREEFTDITNDKEAMMLARQIYWNLFPVDKEGASGLYDKLTREMALALIARCDTPVVIGQTEYDNRLYDGKYKEYAKHAIENNVLKLDSKELTAQNYKEAITEIEFIGLIINRYFKEEGYDIYNSEKAGNKIHGYKVIKDLDTDLGVEQYPNSKVYEWQYCLKHDTTKINEEMYNIIKISEELGITDINYEGYKDELTMMKALDFIDKAYRRIKITSNVKLGDYREDTGLSPVQKPIYAEPTEEPVQVAEEPEEPKALTIDEILEKYKDEISMTKEEIKDARAIEEKYSLMGIDKYMLVNHCTWLNVRKGPSAEHEIICSVPKGTEVHIVGLREDNGWYRVIANGKILYQNGVYFSDKK